jgi:hypothetical protein
MMVHSLMSRVVESRSVYFDDAVLGRLAIRSLLEDGEFVSAILKPFTTRWVGIFQKCLKRAAANGDLREFPITPDLHAWFVHHIALV